MILCIGTTPAVQRTMLFQRLTLDDVNRATQVREYASGKSINVARVLNVLGREALAVGFAGGRRGNFVLEELRRENIPADFIPIAAQTRLCTTLIDQENNQVTEIVEESPAATDDEWEALIALIDKHAASAEMLIFSGTLAAGGPVDWWPARWLNSGRAVMVDAKGEPMRRALSACGPIIAKLNRAEFEQTIGEKFEDQYDEGRAFEAAVRSHAPVEGALIVTGGRSGAVASIAGQFYRIHAPKLRAISPIGSGDAFAAGLAAGWNTGPVEALRLACACGAANALTPDSGHVHRADIERLKPLVRIETT